MIPWKTRFQLSHYMDVSENSGTPKSSILIGFSIIFTIHFGVPLFLETPIYIYIYIHNLLIGPSGTCFVARGKFQVLRAFSNSFTEMVFVLSSCTKTLRGNDAETFKGWQDICETPMPMKDYESISTKSNNTITRELKRMAHEYTLCVCVIWKNSSNKNTHTIDM